MTSVENTGQLVLDQNDIAQFVEQGFIRLDHAFAPSLADDARTILWQDMGMDPLNPVTWSEPVIRLGMYSQLPFVAAANTPKLHAAYDQLVGQGRWQRPGAMGSFVVRFPFEGDPYDAGWHVDVSFGYENPDFMEWRANIISRGRMLLMLFLFSDVGTEDGPTRIRAGSHHIIARQLAKHGDEGLTLRELARDGFSDTSGCKEALATGPAGSVYLCHPFLVHSAQAHKGHNPRFLAQPPLLPMPGMSAGDAAGLNFPVGQVIAQALCG